MILSTLKSSLLAGADGFNALVGGPQPFTRQALLDPSGHFVDDMTRRDYIAAAAEDELVKHFVRDGVFFAQTPNDLGDTAIWQGVYTAMTAMRHRARPTKETWAEQMYAARALARYLHGGRLARGAVPVELEGVMFHRDPTKVYYDEDGVVYREDASLDSLLGVMFGAAIVRRFGDGAAQAVLAGPLEAFAARFEADGFRLTNRDGSPTTYGDCRPGFFQAPVRILAAALPSILGDGPVAPAWRKIAKTYGREFATTDTQVPGRISYVNAHLAILANIAFVAAAPSGAPGVEAARAGLYRLVDKYADAGNSLVVFGSLALGLFLSVDARDKASKTLSEFPLGAKPKTGLNSSVAPALQPVPVWQRPPADVIWQRSPYPYSGHEEAEYCRMDYLLAHYFQRSC